MELVILVLALLSLHIFQFYIRNKYFHRNPLENSRKASFSTVLSPVEGTIVYSRKLSINSFIDKQGRKLPVPDTLNPYTEYYHIGIFMTPYDNHHMLNPIPLNIKFNMKEVSGINESMMDVNDMIFPFIWARNWLDKKIDKYLAVNARTIFTYDNGLVAALIYDKYVNKFTMYDNWKLTSGRKVIGFVHRGSQVDLFIPVSKVSSVEVVEGQKVTHSSIIFKV